MSNPSLQWKKWMVSKLWGPYFCYLIGAKGGISNENEYPTEKKKQLKTHPFGVFGEKTSHNRAHTFEFV